MQAHPNLPFRTLAAIVFLVAVFGSLLLLQYPSPACEDPYIREIEQTSRAIHRSGATADLHFRRAKAYAELGQHAKAAADYTQALALGTPESDILLPRAKCLSVAGQNEEALQDLLRAQEILPPSAGLCHRLADVYCELKRYEESQAAFAQGLELAPEDAPLLTCQARMFRAQGDPEAASRGYDAALRIDPEYIYAYDCRGRLLLDQDEYKGAIADFTRVIQAPTTCYLRRMQLRAYAARYAAARAGGIPGYQLDPFRAGIVAGKLKRIEQRIQAAEQAGARKA